MPGLDGRRPALAPRPGPALLGAGARAPAASAGDWHEPPERPGGRRGLRRFYEEATADLRRQLERATDTEPAWTWHDEQTVGFIRRRQAHEAAIHRVDAELAAGRPVTPIDAGLAGDGILECLGIMYAGVPPWAEFVPDGTTVELAPTDGPDPVRVALGRAVGEDPEGGRLDAPDLAVVAPRGPADATVRATASHLDAWLWHRLDGGVDVEGSREAFDRFAAVVSSPIS